MPERGNGLAAEVAQAIQERDEARQQIAEAQAAVERVRALHAPVVAWTGQLTYVAQCGHCASLCHSRSGLGCDSPDAPWPCDTIRALDGEPAEGEASNE